MIRAIALSLALLIGIGVIVPLATDYAEAGAKKHRKYAKKKKKITQKHWVANPNHKSAPWTLPR